MSVELQQNSADLKKEVNDVLIQIKEDELNRFNFYNTLNNEETVTKTKETITEGYISDAELEKIVAEGWDLSDIEQITDRQAIYLSSLEWDLFLNWLKSLSDKQVEILSKHKGWLSLGGLEQITDRQAIYLLSHEWELSLDGLKSLSDKQAWILSKHKGWLSLGGLEQITDRQAIHLSSHEWNLSLDGLKSLSDKQAGILSKHKRYLSLGGLEKLSDKQALYLARTKWALLLDWLKELSKKQAVFLSSHTGAALSLRWLKKFDNVGVLLKNYKGDLYLPDEAKKD